MPSLILAAGEGVLVKDTATHGASSDTCRSRAGLGVAIGVALVDPGRTAAMARLSPPIVVVVFGGPGWAPQPPSTATPTSIG